MLPSTIDSIHKSMKRVLNEYSEEDLRKAFVVVEPGRHRYRRIKGITKLAADLRRRTQMGLNTKKETGVRERRAGSGKNYALSQKK